MESPARLARDSWLDFQQEAFISESTRSYENRSKPNIETNISGQSCDYMYKFTS